MDVAHIVRITLPFVSGVILLVNLALPVSLTRFRQVMRLSGDGTVRLASNSFFIMNLGVALCFLLLPPWLLRYMHASAWLCAVGLWTSLMLLLASGEFANDLQGPCNAAYLMVDAAFVMINIAYTLANDNIPARLQLPVVIVMLAVQTFVTVCSSCIANGHMTSGWDGRTQFLRIAFLVIYACGIPLVARQIEVFRATLNTLRNLDVPPALATVLCVVVYVLVLFVSINSIAIGWTLILLQDLLLPRSHRTVVYYAQQIPNCIACTN